MISTQSAQGFWAVIIRVTDMVDIGRSVGTAPRLCHVLVEATPLTLWIAPHDERAYLFPAWRQRRATPTGVCHVYSISCVPMYKVYSGGIAWASSSVVIQSMPIACDQI